MKIETGKRRLAAILLSLAVTTTAMAAPEPPLGRFVGVLRHESLQRDQLAKLDFVASREDGNVLRLMAVLTLQFGDFASGEYVAYHFDDVRFNLLTQNFVFDQSDQGITLVAKQYSGTEFVGEFRSSFSGDIGKVMLRKEAPAEPKLPLIEPIWGEYRGKCVSNVGGKKVDTTLQLYSYRSTEGAVQVGNPFRAYKIKGFLGEQHGGEGCLSGSTRDCVWGNIRSGSYNFYKKRLVLFNNYRNLSCTTEQNGLQCGGCDFLKRVSSETNGSRRVFFPPTSSSILGEVAAGDRPALEGDMQAIQGEYHGYLHHEYLDRYQLGSLNILTYQASPSTGQPVTLRMSAVAALHFANEEGTESLSYKFDERSYPSPLLTPQFVFSQPKGDVDAVLQVTSLGNGTVKGVWYSQLFGRVGTFVFVKQELPKLPSGVKLMEPLSAHYQSTDWELDLLVGMGTSAPNTENPFGPLTFGGWILMPSVTPKIHITGGSYDFYTGRIGLEVGENIVQLGQRDSRSRLFLKKMYYAVLSPLPPHDLAPYRLIGTPEN